MTPEISLLIHNIAAILSTVSVIAICIFIVATNKPRKTANTTWSIGMFFIIVFYISHLFGVNVTDSRLSQLILMSNICIIFITMFLNHAVLALIGLNRRRNLAIIIVHFSGLILAIFYALNPESFLALSTPKLYFPNYYVAGDLHWIMRVFFNNVIPLYFTIEMIVAYRQSSDPSFRNRLRWLITALLLGYVTGFIPVLLVFGIPVDPIWGIAFGILFVAPLTYGMVRYELMDIKVVAKKAFLYGVTAAVVGGFIIALNSANRWLENTYEGFPLWLIPIISAIIVVIIGALVWKKLRENEVLKYEFVTTATHKFRTPLTHIKWATENLLKAETAEERENQIRHIEAANAKLVELTNILMNVSKSEDTTYEYHARPADISELAKEVADSLKNQTQLKKLSFTVQLQPSLIAKCDPERIKFVIQTLVENAISYTKEGGSVKLRSYKNGNEVVVAVEDTGIGISKEESTYLFTKFYRGSDARHMDTEGMGVGLYISKEIISRHDGKIWAEPNPEGQGSRFAFSLKAE